MKAAFLSCICTREIKKQPVWGQLLDKNPDFLFLLGDSVYIDVHTPKFPSEMSDDEFAKHLYSIYSEFIHHPDISQAIKHFKPGHIFSVWDDHDFLWNDAYGSILRKSPVHRSKIDISTSFHEVLRNVLAASDPDLFPSSYTDSAFWEKQPEGLSTPSFEIEKGVWIHLLDVRSFRTRCWGVPDEERTLLGPAQKERVLEAVMADMEGIHIFLSGTTFADWKKYSDDVAWMMGIAERSRSVFLSGDIHRNETDAFYWGGRALHEFTSSGAAVRSAVFLGEEKQNYGWLEIKEGVMSARLFRFGVCEENHSRDISLDTWLPV